MYQNPTNNWIAPEFASWAGPLGEALTQWIYADQVSNPTAYDKPEQWPGCGAVTFVDRSLQFLGVAAGQTASNTLLLGGGRNVIVFSRTATVVPSTISIDPNTVVLPNQLSSFVKLGQIRQDNLVFIDANTPLINTFGWGLAPYVEPIPQRWTGNVKMNYAVTNNTAGQVDVTITYKVAFLNNGRG
jgi:hypothetical protein